MLGNVSERLGILLNTSAVSAVGGLSLYARPTIRSPAPISMRASVTCPFKDTMRCGGESKVISRSQLVTDTGCAKDSAADADSDS